MSKRKFKVGDKVVIKPESVYGPKGVVGTVVNYNNTKYTVEFTNGFRHMFRGAELDYYVEEVKKPAKTKKVEKKEHKFKVGDRIEYKHGDGKTYKGTIVEVDTGLGGGLCLCRLENFTGHNGECFSKKTEGYGTYDHWFCIPYELRKIEEHKKEEPKKAKPKFKVGDIVKGISDRYRITGHDMTKGEVTKCSPTVFWVKVLEHPNKRYIGVEFPVRYEHFEKIAEKEEPKNTIVIYQRDRDVVALDKTTGQKCFAHCHPDDKFDFKTGAKIAFGRLIGEPVEEKTPTKEVEESVDAFFEMFKALFE